MQAEQTIAHGRDGWDLVELEVDSATGDERMTYERTGHGSLQSHEHTRPRSTRVESEAYHARGDDRLAKIRDGLFGYISGNTLPN